MAATTIMNVHFHNALSYLFTGANSESEQLISVNFYKSHICFCWQ